MRDTTRTGLLAAGFMLPWAAAALAGRLAYRLTVQHGQDLLEIEALQRRVHELSANGPPSALPSSGLPIGTKLQDFELPDLDGRKVALHTFRGRRLLLIFVDPSCAHSTALLPRLATLAADGVEGRPMPLVLTNGGVEENRALLIRTHKLQFPVLRQDDMEVGTLYQVSGTPAAYLVDEAGMTASTLALGGEAVLGLAGAVGVGQPVESAVTQRHRSLDGSRIARSGLPAGTTAPHFRLPRIDGGEVDLTEYRGRRVLLVFSDPTCGPCTAVAPELERIHREFPDLHVLMISRGDREANRAKAQEHRLTFPIALQRHWDVSRAYGMFATPIAFLIDENGVIAADVAVGPEAIVGLVSGDAGRREVAAQR